MIRFAVLVVAMPGLLTACARLDPLTQPGHWVPTGANDANLRAEVANPHDLVHGQSDPYSDGTEAANAIERWRTDRVKPLQQSGVSDLKSTGNADQPGTGQSDAAGSTLGAQ